MDFRDLSYLKKGNDYQKRAFETLNKNQVMHLLEPFDPILVGTIPININIENSDLDIICYWQNKADFISCLYTHFKDNTDFKINLLMVSGNETIIANFVLDDFEIEIFGQNIPTTLQHGYRHLIIEHQILAVKGETFRQQIIQLKNDGLKTEPAFAQLLNLQGNPYEMLLNYNPDKPINRSKIF